VEHTRAGNKTYPSSACDHHDPQIRTLMRYLARCCDCLRRTKELLAKLDKPCRLCRGVVGGVKRRFARPAVGDRQINSGFLLGANSPFPLSREQRPSPSSITTLNCGFDAGGPGLFRPPPCSECIVLTTLKEQSPSDATCTFTAPCAVVWIHGSVRCCPTKLRGAQTPLFQRW